MAKPRAMITISSRHLSRFRGRDWLQDPPGPVMPAGPHLDSTQAHYMLHVKLPGSPAEKVLWKPRDTLLNLEAVRNFQFETFAHAYSRRESILYALGLGYGSEPTDPAQLAFVYEDNLRVVSSMCCVLAHPGMWVRDPALGID